MAKSEQTRILEIVESMQTNIAEINVKISAIPEMKDEMKEHREEHKELAKELNNHANALKTLETTSANWHEMQTIDNCKDLHKLVKEDYNKISTGQSVLSEGFKKDYEDLKKGFKELSENLNKKIDKALKSSRIYSFSVITIASSFAILVIGYLWNNAANLEKYNDTQKKLDKINEKFEEIKAGRLNLPDLDTLKYKTSNIL